MLACAVLAVIASRVSVRLSQAGVVGLHAPKGLHVESRKQRCTIAKGFCSFMMQKYLRYSDGSFGGRI